MKRNAVAMLLACLIQLALGTAEDLGARLEDILGAGGGLPTRALDALADRDALAAFALETQQLSLRDAIADGSEIQQESPSGFAIGSPAVQPQPQFSVFPEPKRARQLEPLSSGAFLDVLEPGSLRQKAEAARRAQQ